VEDTPVGRADSLRSVIGPLLVYDGECGFCSRTAHWVADGLPVGTRVEPWQSLPIADLGLSEHDVTTAAWWIDESGRRHRGSRAVARALAAGRGWRRVAGRLLLLPPLSWLAVPVYELVARNRGRLPGAADLCRVPQRD
jgi:predicted DCC family thiol-disulfide oxidoreductase YuxK